jgi:2-polyprenyl-3-methyl-5-hydroxy-6-metoxy-1,4-benzoquinol methylase
MDKDSDRVKFVLEGQQHCDHFLTPLASPASKTVLVAGVGAGTEMLWCLRHGASEVVGVDIAEQTPHALLEAARQLGVDGAGRFSILRLPIEKADTIGRKFDLVLSNNVFEHLPDIDRALQVCAELVEPYTGRIAIFTDPLFHSSAGSHLPVEPWQHLWGNETVVREGLLKDGLPLDHPLQSMPLDKYLFREITLNRMRLDNLLAAIRKSGLAILNLKLFRDRNLDKLAEYRDRVAEIPVTDLAIEGIGVELAQVVGTPIQHLSYISTEEAVLGQRWANAVAEHNRSLEDARRSVEGVRNSLEFRLGRLLTLPLRWIQGRERPK